MVIGKQLQAEKKVSTIHQAKHLTSIEKFASSKLLSPNYSQRLTANQN